MTASSSGARRSRRRPKPPTIKERLTAKVAEQTQKMTGSRRFIVLALGIIGLGSLHADALTANPGVATFLWCVKTIGCGIIAWFMWRTATDSGYDQAYDEIEADEPEETEADAPHDWTPPSNAEQKTDAYARSIPEDLVRESRRLQPEEPHQPRAAQPRAATRRRPTEPREESTHTDSTGYTEYQPGVYDLRITAAAEQALINEARGLKPSGSLDDRKPRGKRQR